MTVCSALLRRFGARRGVDAGPGVLTGRRAAWLAAALAVLISACGPGGSASPSPSAAAFTVEVSPPEAPAAVRAAIPGQETSFLVSFSDRAGSGGAATVSATALGGKIERIVPTSLKAGQVGEVWVITDPKVTADTTESVTITVTRGGLAQTVERTILVYPMSGEGRARDAQPHLDYWTAWLAADHPELGIRSGASWEPVFVSILLVVSHMSYFSEEWELGLAWHAATIPPNDWSEIYLRRRGTEMAPSLAFRVDSFSARTAPHAVAPPEVVVR